MLSSQGAKAVILAVLSNLGATTVRFDSSASTHGCAHERPVPDAADIQPACSNVSAQFQSEMRPIRTDATAASGPTAGAQDSH